jgi:hypothetical protein
MKETTHKNTVRLNFEFPREEYPYLKLLCAKRGLSLRDFGTELFIKAIEEAEDELLAQKANKRLEQREEKDLIDWDEATRLAGWDNDKVQPNVRKKVRKRVRKNPRTV